MYGVFSEYFDVFGLMFVMYMVLGMMLCNSDNMVIDLFFCVVGGVELIIRCMKVFGFSGICVDCMMCVFIVNWLGWVDVIVD